MLNKVETKAKSITVSKVCGGAMCIAMLYLFFVDGKSFGGWTAFLVFLTLTILLHTIEELSEDKAKATSV
jgi:hypothetical protein